MMIFYNISPLCERLEWREEKVRESPKLLAPEFNPLYATERPKVENPDPEIKWFGPTVYPAALDNH